MSGHCKWPSIKHKKGATDKKRGQLFSKLARAIIVAAREGGPDPAANLALQNAIDKAREASMPKDNIERAIARGSGAAADGEAFEHVTYEGYGPAGVAVFVDALTDNRNRTASEVRHVFSKSDGSLGESGSVAWLFERTGCCSSSADGRRRGRAHARGGRRWRRRRVPRRIGLRDHVRRRERRRRHGARSSRRAFAVESAQITMLPKTSVTVEDEGAARRIVRLMEELEELDDVQDVYANFDIPEPSWRRPPIRR